MSVAVLPTSQTDPSTTAEQCAKRDEAFFEAMEVLDQTRACNLFPPELDFGKACPCDECGSKIAKLKASEKKIKAKKDLISEHVVQVQNKELLCSDICSSAWWSKKMLDIFKKKLEALDESEKSGVPLRLVKSRSAESLGDLDLEIREMMINSGLLAKPAEKVVVVDDDDDDDDVLDEIDRGRFYYGKTKAKDTAYCLLQKIEDIEKHHDKDKKTAEAQNKMPDPSISKIYIENQVELVKKLPVQELLLELVELIDELKSKETDWKMFKKARGCICRICSAVITERNAFWNERNAIWNGGNEHISNGVNQTLDSLIAKVTSFHDEWKKVYATFFTPHDRAGPKRQRA